MEIKNKRLKKPWELNQGFFKEIKKCWEGENIILGEIGLSICMMVKDEEKNIKRCLESLKSILLQKDIELIIVDTGSKDKTVEIAKSYTNQVFYKEWNSNFSEMRNYTISLAKGDWVFILDADEEVENPEIILSEIERAGKQQAKTICVGVRNLTNEDDKKNYVLNVSPRIFKKGFIKYQGTVHNQPIFHQPVFYSNITIYHYGYILSDSRLMEYKYKRTVSLLLKELEKDPANIYYRYQLGVSYGMYGKLKEANIEFEKAYNLLKRQNSEIKKGFIVLYGLYGGNLLALGLYDRAYEIAEEGLNFNSEYLDLYYIAGRSLYEMGKRQEAIEYLKRYLEIFKGDKKTKIFNDISLAFYYVSEYYVDQVNSLIVQYYIDVNNFDSAKKHIDLFKDNKLKIRYYALLYLRSKSYNDVKGLYSQCEEKEKEFLSEFIEKYIVESKLDEDEKNEVHNEFSQFDDLYGKYCKVMIKASNIKENVHDILKADTIKTLPAFYIKSLFSILEEKEFLINILKNLDVLTLRIKIAEVLASKFIDFEDVINLLDIIKNEKSDQDIIACYIAVALVVLLNFPRQTDERLYKIFLNYTENGMLLMNKLYKAEEIKEKYKYFLSEEEKYFALMYLIYLSLQKKRMDESIKYLREAISTMPKLLKHLKMFSKDILGVDV